MKNPSILNWKIPNHLEKISFSRITYFCGFLDAKIHPPVKKINHAFKIQYKFALYHVTLFLYKGWKKKENKRKIKISVKEIDVIYFYEKKSVQSIQFDMLCWMTKEMW